MITLTNISFSANPNQILIKDAQTLTHDSHRREEVHKGMVTAIQNGDFPGFDEAYYARRKDEIMQALLDSRPVISRPVKSRIRPQPKLSGGKPPAPPKIEGLSIDYVEVQNGDDSRFVILNNAKPGYYYSTEIRTHTAYTPVFQEEVMHAADVFRMSRFTGTISIGDGDETIRKVMEEVTTHIYILVDCILSYTVMHTKGLEEFGRLNMLSRSVKEEDYQVLIENTRKFEARWNKISPEDVVVDKPFGISVFGTPINQRFQYPNVSLDYIVDLWRIVQSNIEHYWHNPDGSNDEAFQQLTHILLLPIGRQLQELIFGNLLDQDLGNNKSHEELSQQVMDIGQRIIDYYQRNGREKDLVRHKIYDPGIDRAYVESLGIQVSPTINQRIENMHRDQVPIYLDYELLRRDAYQREHNITEAQWNSKR